MTRSRSRPAWRRLATPLARLAVAATAAGVAIACAGLAAGPERHWLFAQLQYLPYLAFLLPALAALALSALLTRPWRLAALASLALVATVLMGFELPGPEDGTGAVRVMTYNVKGYLAREQPGDAWAVVAEIARHDPDILVLQDAREFVAAEAALKAFGPRQVETFGQYVVASRFPMRGCRLGRISFRDRQHSFVHCLVTAHGVEIDVVTAHFVTPRHGLNAIREQLGGGVDEWQQNVEDRMTQSRALAAHLAKRVRPVIVAGDLNAPPRSLVTRGLTDTGLTDAFEQAGTGYGYTWGHSLRPGLSFLRIDRVLVSAEFAVRGCFTGGDEGSPHRPVIADLRLARKAA